MNETLTNELCTYLGELMQQNENNKDWQIRDKIVAKINAVNVLLDIDHKHKTFFDIATEIIHTNHKK